MPDWLSDWLLPNLGYDLLRTVVVAIVAATGATLLFGPIFRLLRERRQLIALWLVISITVCLVIAYIRPPQPAPQFSLTVHSMFHGGTSQNSPSLEYPVLLLVTIGNKGYMPSIMHGATLIANIDDHQFAGVLLEMPNSITLDHPSGKTYTFYKEDDLLPKAQIPIQPGAAVSGVLLFNIPGLNRDTVRGSKLFFVFECKDIMGHIYKEKLTRNPALVPPYRIPGVRQDIR